MSDILPQVEAEQNGQVTKIDVPVSRYLAEAFHAGQGDSMYRAMSNITEDDLNTGTKNVLQPDQANAKYGVGSLKFEHPVDEALASVLSEREKNKMDQDMYLYSGATRGRFLPGMAASILGATANPLDLGSMFIPFVGEAAKVPAVTRVGRILQRGLISQESIAKTGIPAPRLVANMVHGAAWMGMADIPKMYEAHIENRPMPDVGLDMLGQAGFAAILHGAGAGLRMLSSKTHEVMAKQAMNDFLEDKPITAHIYIPLDEEVIKQQAMEHDRVLREQAANEINLQEIKNDLVKEKGEYPIDAATRSKDTGEVRTAAAHSLIDINGMGTVEEGFVTDNGRFVSREEAHALAVGEDGSYNHHLLDNDKKLTSEQLHETSDPDYLSHNERVMFDDLKEQYQMTDAEALNKIREARMKKREQRILANPEVQKEIEVRRQAAIERWVEDKKRELNQPARPEVDKLAKETTVPREQVQKYAGDDAALNKSLDDDVAELKQSLKPSERPPEVDHFEAVLNSIIQKLESDPTKLMFDPFLLQTLGKPLLKGLLVSIREAYKESRNLWKAINQAFEEHDVLAQFQIGDHARIEKHTEREAKALIEQHLSDLFDNTVVGEKEFYKNLGHLGPPTKDYFRISEKYIREQTKIREQEEFEEDAHMFGSPDEPSIFEDPDKGEGPTTSYNYDNEENWVKGKTVAELLQKYPDLHPADLRAIEAITESDQARDIFESAARDEEAFEKEYMELRPNAPKAIDEAVNCLLNKIL